jgi:asparagine synthase (glutamine-hydrolysing)
MGGFYLGRTDGDDDALSARLATAEEQLRRHGFTELTPIRTAHYRGFHAAPVHGGPACLHHDGDDFVAVAGTLIYDGKIGEPALRALLAGFRFPFDDWDRTTGQFAAIVHKHGKAHAFTDFFGAFQLFHDPDWRVVSTSFLAAAKSLERVSFDPQGIYEFAFNVFPTGDDSVIAELKRLGPDAQVELGDSVRRERVEKPLPDRVSSTPVDRRIAAQAARLRATTRIYAEAFGDKVQCPLSGGLDSRLALALLRDAGIDPFVYVYGSPGDGDVEIARMIAKAEHFRFEAFEKSSYADITPGDFAAIVERNFHETDALVTDGGLFDNGGNAFARHRRQEGGQLAVSGGCGEVFRNFFYLPDRPMTARAVMRAFFARYTRSDTTEVFDAAAFLDRLEAKALAALDLPGNHRPLRRPVIEQLYPRMRCRAFFGREISLVGRHGAYFMPFFDHHVVAGALQLPIGLKNAGRFEAGLLTHIDPVLAGYPSGYGHSFDNDPTFAQRMNELGTRVRPAWMRQRSYAVRRRLGPMRDEHGGLLTPAFLGRVLDLHFPHMRRFFRIANISDTGLYRRVATLEYLAQHIERHLFA